MGGTIAAVSNLLVLWLGSNPVESGFGYFIIANCFIVVALIGFWMLPFVVMLASKAHNVNNDQTVYLSVTHNMYDVVYYTSS